MSATTSFQSAILRHILLNESVAWIGDEGGLLPSAASGYVYVCLFTRDPGEAGDITNEAAYEGYARVAVPRGSSGWSEANGQARNFIGVDFPKCTGGSETETHFGICKTATGDDMIFSDELPSDAMVFIEIEPRMEVGQLAINMD